MAQTYKMMLGTSGKQWELLTVREDGRMTMTFHGTDREISHEVTENADGWLCYPGGMFPGLESGKWNMMDDGRCKMEDVRGKMDDVVETTEPAKPEVIETTTDCTNYTNNEPVIVRSALPLCSAKNPKPSDISHQTSDIDQPRPRRQRKPRKPRAERQPSAISHQTSSIDHQPSAISHQTSSTMKAIGMVAAATVALFVIYETGLLIPLGLIGLATGGILK